MLTTGSLLVAADFTFTDVNNSNYESYVERTHMDFGDQKSSKDISTIYPFTDGAGEMTITTSAINASGVSVDLSTTTDTTREYTFRPFRRIQS